MSKQIQPKEEGGTKGPAERPESSRAINGNGSSPSQEWEKRLDTVEFGFDVDGKKLKKFINSLLSSQKAELREKVEGMRKPLEERIAPFRHYNQALDEVLSLLEPTIGEAKDKGEEEKKTFSDVFPFKHGEEGTHYACAEMAQKFKENMGCCGCNGHNCQKKEVGE